MINLNECKFGDKLKMRNGKMAIYACISPYSGSHILFIESVESGYVMLFAADNGVVDYMIENSYDIVGKWEDEE